MAKTLVAYCPRCRVYARIDGFAGSRTYLPHYKPGKGLNRCKNSDQPCFYRPYDYFAGLRAAVNGPLDSTTTGGKHG